MDLETIFTSATVATAVATLAQFILRKIFSNTFDTFSKKKIEAYKHDLSLFSEKQKFEYQRWTTDFNLYTQKKHEAYSELYRLILIADGALQQLVGFREVPSFEEYDRKDMENYLKGYQVVGGHIPTLLDCWEQNRDACIEKTREYLIKIDFQKAEQERQKAKNFYVIHTLYLSETVEKLVSEILSKLVRQFVMDRQMIVKHYSRDDYPEQSKEIIEKKNELLGQLKHEMRKELSVGYYEQQSL